MAKKTIKELESVTTLNPTTDYLLVAQEGSDRKQTVADFKNNILSLPENFDYNRDVVSIELNSENQVSIVNLSDMVNRSLRFDVTIVAEDAFLGSININTEGYNDGDLLYLNSNFLFSQAAGQQAICFIVIYARGGYESVILQPLNVDQISQNINIQGWHVVKNGGLWKL